MCVEVAEVLQQAVGRGRHCPAATPLVDGRPHHAVVEGGQLEERLDAGVLDRRRH